MNIREANINDAEGIANVHVKSWQFAYVGIMPEEYLFSLSAKEKTGIWLKSLSEKSLGINIVLEINKEIIGFCVFGPARDKDLLNQNVGELVALNILPRYWGNGYYLWVLKQNERAIGVYEKKVLFWKERRK